MTPYNANTASNLLAVPFSHLGSCNKRCDTICKEVGHLLRNHLTYTLMSATMNSVSKQADDF